MTETAQFGAKRVPLAAKQALVNDVFHSVARRYDLMNDLMSFGLHRAWKNALVTAVNPPKAAPFAVLDIAGGTGDIAFRIIEAGGAQTRVTVSDINPDMLEVGRERAAINGGDAVVTFAEANAEALPFADRSFDAVTIAFGIRNVPRVDRALAEAFRVLKIGGILSVWNSRWWTSRRSTGSMISIRSTSFRHWAGSWPETPNLTAIWWNPSAAFPSRKPSPRCCARQVSAASRSRR